MMAIRDYPQAPLAYSLLFFTVCKLQHVFVVLNILTDNLRDSHNVALQNVALYYFSISRTKTSNECIYFMHEHLLNMVNDSL